MLFERERGGADLDQSTIANDPCTERSVLVFPGEREQLSLSIAVDVERENDGGLLLPVFDCSGR